MHGNSGARGARPAPRHGAAPSTLFSIAAAAILALGTPGGASAQSRDYPQRYAAERVLVQPRPGLSLAQLDRILQQHGGRRSQAIKQINVHVVELPPQANEIAVAQALQKNPHIKFAELDSVLTPVFYPNDPRYPTSWHLPKIGAPTAWDSAQGSGVIIAILDSGVDTTHPDLQSQLVPGWNHYDKNDNVADVTGHGTTVAGVAAAAANNGIGVASVGFGARIMPLRVTDTTGGAYSSVIAAALTTAADNGARVANISFLGVSFSSTVDSAAQYMRSKGGVVVVAAGNTGALRTDPPRESLTAVAATDSADARASFSSWGDYVDVAAPGVSISTTTRGGGYGGASGTSVASPVVAGVYALMMSANPALPPATLDSILLSTALDLGAGGWDQTFGYGRVQAAAAVAKARQTSATDTQAPTVAITSPAGGAVSGLVPVDTSVKDNVAVARAELYANGALVATETLSPYGFTLDSARYPDGQVTLQVKAYDTAGNSASSSPVAVTVSNDTTPPAVQINSPANGSLVSGTVSVSVSATDNQRVAQITLTIDGRQVAVAYGPSLSYSWSVPAASKGRKSSSVSTLSARALDAAGNGAVATVSVTRK